MLSWPLQIEPCQPAHCSCWASLCSVGRLCVMRSHAVAMFFRMPHQDSQCLKIITHRHGMELTTGRLVEDDGPEACLLSAHPTAQHSMHRSVSTLER